MQRVASIGPVKGQHSNPTLIPRQQHISTRFKFTHETPLSLDSYLSDPPSMANS